jgi:transcriptional regulator with XRE-family HTH domain
MAQAQQETKETAHSAFAAKLKWLRERQELSQSDVAVEMKKRGQAVSQKSISNLERLEHDSQISNFAAVAAHFGVPLWVMFIPGMDTSMLEAGKLKRLVTMVENYLSLEDADRVHVEAMAAGFAKLKAKK